MTNQTRYIKPQRTPIPKLKRPHPLWGADDHSGRFFKCWVCGFICDSERDKVGDGVGYHSRVVVDPGTFVSGAGDIKDTILSVDNDTIIHLSAIGSDGTPIPTVHNFSYEIFEGCRNCGSKNYR